jgi:ABC-type molybdate transport system substrate-binding protein
LSSATHEFNLGNSQFEALYEHVTAKFEHQRFETMGLDRLGKTIYYGLTIPKNAVQKDLAPEFACFLMGEEWRSILESNWHPFILPAYSDSPQSVPSSLQQFVVQEQ